jgi:plastocyanin
MRASLLTLRSVVTTSGIVVATSLVLWPLIAERANPRDIVMVARDMAFFEAGSATRNPSIRVRSGEHIALTFRNEEPGITHDFAITEWSLATRPVLGGEVDRIVFTVPDATTGVEYVCRPHSATMRGAIVVE